MSDENKPKLEVVSTQSSSFDDSTAEHITDPELAAVLEEEPKEPSKFDEEEKAAYLLSKEHPKLLMGALKKMAKDKPNALARVMYNLVLFPFEAVDLLGKEEKELYGYVEQVMRDKRQVLFYADRRRKETEKELIQQATKTNETGDKT